MSDSFIEHNLDEVEKKIQAACDRSGRNREEVTLIAVSKTKPLEMLEAAYQTGIREFGENKVQELTWKYDELPKDIHWHLIGHLQRNKVKYIVDKACLIHSVDSLRLAEEISKEAQKKDVTVSILVQVNVANEETKFGLESSQVLDMITAIARLPKIHICGLMTIAPFVENPEDNRIYFRKLKKLSVDINAKNIDNIDMNILSMGMTGDYEVAIEEGATMVRVGTGIFGERHYDV